MNQKITLPKLKPVQDPTGRKKILLLSDDMRMHSGIATVSRDFVIETSDRFDWVQLGAAQEHPDHGKVFDISEDVGKVKGIDNANVKIYAHTGYGTAEVLRELIAIEKPDAILHFTDPRFWEWLYMIEHEIRSHYKIPIMYYNIWDCPPAPYWNKSYYESCDLIMNISKQTHNLVKMVLGNDLYRDMDSNTGDGDILLSHVPHGINQYNYYPITEDSEEWEEYNKIVESFKTSHNVDFIVFWNNRNIRRKQPGDVVLAYKKFCDMLPEDKKSRVALFMHTAMLDPNGTDLPEVVRVCCPNYKVIFNEERLPTNVLNYFYNMADITINMASNEGFGLSTAESIMSGTPVVVNVTGGLQDQIRFQNESGEWINFTETFTSNHTGVYKNHGEWAKPVFPTNRSLQGSLQTPYIFDDRCDFSDVAEKIMEWYNLSTNERKEAGLRGREWMISKESGMSTDEMGNRIAKSVEKCLNTFSPKKKFEIYKISDRTKITNPGIIWQ
jgi:glycosyltransferase involved in cell wall biosynthesis